MAVGLRSNFSLNQLKSTQLPQLPLPTYEPYKRVGAAQKHRERGYEGQWSDIWLATAAVKAGSTRTRQTGAWLLGACACAIKL